MDLQRKHAALEVRTQRAGAAQRGPEDLAERDREHRRRGIRAVVDVVGETGGRAGEATSADQPDRVDLEQQRGRAALVTGLGIEDVCRAHGHVEALHPVGVLVQQEAEIGRLRRGGGDGKEHQDSLREDLASRPSV